MAKKAVKKAAPVKRVTVERKKKEKNPLDLLTESLMKSADKVSNEHEKRMAAKNAEFEKNMASAKKKIEIYVEVDKDGNILSTEMRTLGLDKVSTIGILTNQVTMQSF